MFVEDVLERSIGYTDHENLLSIAALRGFTNIDNLSGVCYA